MADISPQTAVRLRTLLQNTGPLVLSRLASGAISLITTIAATRWLGVDRFGEASLALAYPLLLWSVTSVKSVSITTRYLSSFHAQRDIAGINAICLFGYLVDVSMAMIALLVVLTTGSLVAASIYGAPHLYWLMLIMAASFPIYSLGGTNEAILTAYSRFGAIASLLVVESALRLVLVLGGWAAGGGAASFVAATAASQVIVGAIGFSMAMTTLRNELGSGWWHDGSLKAIARFKNELWQFSGWNYALVTMSGFVDQLPAMVLGAHHGTSSVAFYRLSTSLMVTVGYVEASLRRAVYPKLLADWNDGGITQLRTDVRPMTLRIGVPAGVAITAAAAILIPFAIPALFGENYSGMTRGTQLMIAAAGVSAVFFWLHPYYFAAGRIVLWSKLYVAYAVAFVAVAWLMSDWWGFFGAACVVAAGRIILAIAGVLVARSPLFGRG